MHCPLCHHALEPMDFGKAHVYACGGSDGCGAALVLANQLVPLMHFLAGNAMHNIDLDEEIVKVEPMVTACRCAHCHGPMEPFRYMGSPLVNLYRCSGQHMESQINPYTRQPQMVDRGPMIFGSAEELGVAAMLYARTQRRLGERKAKDDKLREGWARGTRARNAGRASAHVVGTGLLMGGLPGAAIAAAAMANLKKTKS